MLSAASFTGCHERRYCRAQKGVGELDAGVFEGSGTVRASWEGTT